MDFQRYIPISKVDDDKRMVYGPATSTAWDSQGDSFEWPAIVKALDGYRQWGNVREMHRPEAVGVAVEYTIDEVQKSVELGAHIVDDAAWAKVKSGVYKGFSVGGRAREVVTAMRKLEDGREVPGRLIKAWDWLETSLVDRPANPEATFTLFKREAEPEGAVVAASGNAGPTERAPAPDGIAKGDAIVTVLTDLMKSAGGVDAALELWNQGTVRGALGEDAPRVAKAVADAAAALTGGRFDMADDSTITKKGETPPDPAAFSAFMAEMRGGMAAIHKRLDDVTAAQEPIAKVDFSTFAKAEAIDALGERLAKVEGHLVPGGPAVNANGTPQPVTKGQENPADGVSEDVLALAKVDTALAATGDPIAKAALQDERARLLIKAAHAAR